MAKRIITALIAIPFGIFILVFDHIFLFCTVVAALSVGAVYEMLLATKYLKNKAITLISLIFVAILPFSLTIYQLRSNLPIVFGLFIISLLLVMLFMHSRVSFEEISLVAFISITFPLSLSCIPLMRMNYDVHGLFYILFMLLSAWIGDAGAYFVGTFFGKHKMAPKISPNKTWEGFFGGVILSGIAGLVASVIYEYVGFNLLGMEEFHINKVYITIMALVCSIFGVMGDLLASIIKRQCAVKDFGSIMPGHGGVLDRFDSVLLVAPFVYHTFMIMPPVAEAASAVSIGIV